MKNFIRNMVIGGLMGEIMILLGFSWINDEGKCNWNFFIAFILIIIVQSMTECKCYNDDNE